MAYRLTGPAELQLIEVLAESRFRHGEAAKRRYELLIRTALESVGDDPGLPGSWPVRRFPGVRVYEIAQSRHRVPRENRVADPWHKLVYCVADDGVVAILAIVGRSYPAGRAARQALNEG